MLCFVDKVRLVGGPNSKEGRIEAYHNEQWGAVCAEDWDDKDATVVCKMLGYTSGIARTNDYPNSETLPIWLYSVNCDGSEISILDCKYSDDCYLIYDAAVCSGIYTDIY